ncbi:MAG: hypothetical protein R3E91_05680 [Chlamydiales bacterium]
MSVGTNDQPPLVTTNNSFSSSLKSPAIQKDINIIRGIAILALVGIGIAATAGAFSNTSVALGSSVSVLSGALLLIHLLSDSSKNALHIIVLIAFIVLASLFLSGGLVTATELGISILVGPVVAIVPICCCGGLQRLLANAL